MQIINGNNITYGGHYTTRTVAQILRLLSNQRLLCLVMATINERLEREAFMLPFQRINNL